MKNLKTLVLSFMVMMLSSCMVAVMAGAAAGMVVYDKRSFRIIERDARIFHLLQKKIVKNPEFNHSRVNISSFNQVVLLTGQTSSASLRIKAEKDAVKTPDVYKVYNELRVAEPISYKQKNKDSWITGQVRSKMLTRKGLESGSIRIITENSTVFLMGIVTPEQAGLAVNVARHVKGVEKVVKAFQYIR